MTHTLGVSGSTIMSDPERLTELFWGEINHIEIGEFPDEEAFQSFIKLKDENRVTFGVHSPLLRSGSKYDLIEKVKYDTEYAWEQFEKEVDRLSELGAKYVLVHFPFFLQETDKDPNAQIEGGLKRLNRLQEKYHIPIVCEPKLGINRSKAGINYLHQFPVKTWAKYNLSICIDIGDYALAAGDKVLDYIKKWRDFTKVVHLHNVEDTGEKYIWIPVHPSHEKDGTHFKIEKIIKLLTESKEVYFILEHTPHLNPGQPFVEEGVRWLRSIID